MVNTLSPNESQEAQCPECGSTIRVAGRRRRVQCPKCREVVTLVTPEPEKRPGKPQPPVAAAPKQEATSGLGDESGRLAALEARIAAMENSKAEERVSGIERLELRIHAIESGKLKAQGLQLETQTARLDSQRAELEAQSAQSAALEARIAALEHGTQAAAVRHALPQPEKCAPAPALPAHVERSKESPARLGSTESRPGSAESAPGPAGDQAIFGKTVRIASPDELENPIPGLPPLSRVAKSAGVPPGRMRWLAPGESHAPGISPAQEDVLTHNLRAIPGQQITIRTIPGNTFSRQCAESFRGIFERAGWTVHGVEEIPRTVPEPGLSLSVPTLPVEQEAAATYLALKAAGFSPAIVLDTALASGAKEDATSLSLTLGPAKVT